MKRLRAILVVVLLTGIALAALPEASATHEWGHRYMIFGRVLDANGTPAQQIGVQVTVETSNPQDPVINVPTDCQGLYYTWARQQNPNDRGLEAGIMHIHASELPSDADYTVRTEHNEVTGKVRPKMHRTTVNMQLDETLEPQPACDGVADWSTSYIVQGRIQVAEGNNRKDQMTVPEAGLETNVQVTIEDASGEEHEMDVQTNQFGDYFATFENLSLENGGRVTTTWDGNTETGEVDLEYRMSEVNIVTKAPLVSGGVKIFFYALAGIIVLGVVVWAGGRWKDRMDTKKAMEGSTRKRAN